MHELFKKIFVTIPEPKTDYFKNTIQLLLTHIVGDLYINKPKSKPSPIKSTKLRKEEQKREYNSKEYLCKSIEAYNGCKLQIHWNKIEGVVPISSNVKKKILWKYYHRF